MGDVLSEIEETNEDQALEAEQLAVEEPTDQEIAAENRAAEEVPPESAHRLQTELEAESDLSSDSSPSQDKNQRMVNYGALSEERGKRKEPRIYGKGGAERAGSDNPGVRRRPG